MCYSVATRKALFRDRVFWNDNEKLPVYSTPKERIGTEEAITILLDKEFDESLLCQMQPTCVDKNSLFVVDLQKLSNPKDISCDDMGAWRANGTHPIYALIDRRGVITNTSQKPLKGKSPGRQYKLMKRYYYHKAATDLQKTIFIMQGKQ